MKKILRRVRCVLLLVLSIAVIIRIIYVNKHYPYPGIYKLTMKDKMNFDDVVEIKINSAVSYSKEKWLKMISEMGIEPEEVYVAKNSKDLMDTYKKQTGKELELDYLVGTYYKVDYRAIVMECEITNISDSEFHKGHIEGWLPLETKAMNMDTSSNQYYTWMFNGNGDNIYNPLETFSELTLGVNETKKVTFVYFVFSDDKRWYIDKLQYANNQRMAIDVEFID